MLTRVSKARDGNQLMAGDDAPFKPMRVFTAIVRTSTDECGPVWEFGHPIVSSGKPKFRPLRTPADAARWYHQGARLSRCPDDPEALRRALVLLEHAFEIYQENERHRDAAYARVLRAEAFAHLGDFGLAHAELETARKGLSLEEDQDMLQVARTVQAMIDNAPSTGDQRR